MSPVLSVSGCKHNDLTEGTLKSSSGTKSSGYFGWKCIFRVSLPGSRLVHTSCKRTSLFSPLTWPSSSSCRRSVSCRHRCRRLRCRSRWTCPSRTWRRRSETSEPSTRASPPRTSLRPRTGTSQRWERVNQSLDYKHILTCSSWPLTFVPPGVGPEPGGE